MKSPNVCRFVTYGIIFIGLIGAGAAGVVFGVEPVHPKFVIFGILSYIGILFGSVTVRCPYCRKRLNFRGIWTESCPHCGGMIDHKNEY
ncbi:MAG: hypothetical protein EOM28_02445 [Clostridia bacterium]|nr:hypothetical protein [Clostridia bacterium]